MSRWNRFLLRLVRRALRQEIHRIAKDFDRMDTDCGFELLNQLGVGESEG